MKRQVIKRIADRYHFHRGVLMLLISFLIFACSTLPPRISQLYIPFNAAHEGDSVFIHVRNTSQSPIRVFITEKGKVFRQQHKFLLAADADASYGFLRADSIDYGSDWLYGNPEMATEIPDLQLPFLKGKSYKVIQGFNGSFSHKASDFGRYAIDFDLQEGDTVTAAANGVVVGLVSGHTKGGKSKKWLDYANFITLYHSKGNYYTQYVHLQHYGQLVQLGDSVTAGQPIGLSGNTGFTSVPHLHFNVLKPVETSDGLTSVKFNFTDYKGESLKPGDVVLH